MVGIRKLSCGVSRKTPAEYQETKIWKIVDYSPDSLGLCELTDHLPGEAEPKLSLTGALPGVLGLVSSPRQWSYG